MPERITLVTARRLNREETYAGLLPGFETHEQAARNRDTLFESCAQVPNSKPVAAKLEACMSRDRYCQSGACEVCLREARQQLVPQASARLARARKHDMHIWKRYVRQLGECFQTRPELVSITGVDAGLATPRGELDADRVKRAAEAFRQALGRSVLKDTLFFGGWDFSLNYSHEGDPNPKWQPHLFGIAVADKESLREIVKDRFPVTPAVPKPLMVKKVPIQSLPGAVSYAFKSRFCRRIGYVASNGRKSTSIRRLEEDEHRELAVFLDALGINARLILRGLKVTGGRLVDV